MIGQTIAHYKFADKLAGAERSTSFTVLCLKNDRIESVTVSFRDFTNQS